MEQAPKVEGASSGTSALDDGLEGAKCGARALEILEALARLAADGKSITIAEDWGFGTATVIDQDGAHTHVGLDCLDSEHANFEAFVSQLHGLLVGKRGLAWVKPSNAKSEPAAPLFGAPPAGTQGYASGEKK